MAKLIWTITCDRIIIDRETNQVTYVDSIEDIAVASFPAPVFFTVGIVWLREQPEERIRMRVSVLAPDGAALFQKAGDLDHPTAMRHRLNLPLIIMTQNAGFHFVMVEQFVNDEWREECRIPLTVTQQEQEKAEVVGADVQAPAADGERSAR